MSNRHWLASYNGRIPCEIDPDAYALGARNARARDAALRRQARLPLLRPDADLCRHRPAVAPLRGLPAGHARREEGRPHRRDAAEHSGVPARHAGDRARRRGPGERQSALHAARARASAQRRRRRDHRRLQRGEHDARRDHRQDRGASTSSASASATAPASRCRARRSTRGSRTSSVLGCAGARRGAGLHAGRAERRRPAVPAIHRRDHRPVEGRRALASQPRRQHRAVQGVHAGRAASRRGSHRHGTAALSHLRPDGELHLLLLDRRGQLAGAEPARHGQLHRDAAQGALHGVHRREHAVRRAHDAPEDRRGGLLPAARGDRRRRDRAADDVGEMEGAHRQGHPRRLRPVGDLPGAHAQSDDREWLLGDRRPAVPVDRHQAARRRGQGSCRSARRARSAPRARR